jgi:hypothetical protein
LASKVAPKEGGRRAARGSNAPAFHAPRGGINEKTPALGTEVS